MQRIQGLTAHAMDLQLPANFTTRTDEWRIEPRKAELAKEEVSPPWTRFNNCAPVDFIEFSQTAIEIDLPGILLNQQGNEKWGPGAGHRYQKSHGSHRTRPVQSAASAQFEGERT